MKFCLFAVAAITLGLMGACAAPGLPATATVESSAPASSVEAALPTDLPTHFLPDQNPAFFKPGNIIGTVYISDKDRCFHRPDCTRLASKSTGVIRQQAQIQGYSACPKCNP